VVRKANPPCIGIPFWAGAIIGLAAGGFYLLWKASYWRPAEEIIQRDLSRKLAKKLVLDLTDVCAANRLDPEDLAELVGELRNRPEGRVNRQFHTSMVDFFRRHLRMRE